MNSCETCKYWSEMLAMARPETGHEIEAMCLKQNRYTISRLNTHCKLYEEGIPIDSPN